MHFNHEDLEQDRGNDSLSDAYEKGRSDERQALITVITNRMKDYRDNPHKYLFKSSGDVLTALGVLNDFKRHIEYRESTNPNPGGR